MWGVQSKLIRLYAFKTTGYGTYAQVTITTDKRADGSACKAIIFQALQSVELTSEAILIAAIYDVVFNTYIIEEIYFGGDVNW